MKRNQIITFLVAVVLSLAAAQSLPALTPPGAAGGLYTRNLAVKKAFFVNFQAEWNRLGINDLFLEAIKSEPDVTQEDIDEVSKFLSLDLIGREAILTFYADGNFFFMTRPSAQKTAEIIAAIREELESPQQRGGWLIEEDEEDGLTTILGVSSDAILFASKGAADRFFAGDRGLKMPIDGDLALWFDAKPLWIYLDDPSLGIPPNGIAAIKTFTGLGVAANLETNGINDSGYFCFDPSQDADLANIFLVGESAWNIADLPSGVSVSTGMLDLPALGNYINRWAAEFDAGLEIDLTSFGKRFAIVDAGADDPQEVLQNPLGNLLVLLETTDSLTAEVTLLSWLQMAAAFSTPEGQGGFSVEPITVNGREGKAVQLGMAGTLYLVSYDDRLAIATSEAALNLLAAPKLSSNSDFVRLSKMLPAKYVGASYSDNRKTLEQAAQLLPFVMMQSVEDAETQRFMTELTAKLSEFFSFVANRTGGSISYTQRNGPCLQSAGFTQINW